MPYEIERKFLVRADSWRTSAGRPSLIQQGYLIRNGSLSLRVRLIDKAKAMLTIKSPVADIKRLEFEYEIPMPDAAELIAMRESGLVEKLRHKLPWEGMTWEIDVFLGENEGLVIAEIELPHEDCEFAKPGWLGREVTSDPRFSNANLARTPYKRWRLAARAAQREAAYLAPPTD
jgi:adenylate cyclase